MLRAIRSQSSGLSRGQRPAEASRPYNRVYSRTTVSLDKLARSSGGRFGWIWIVLLILGAFGACLR
jgi:hypothetical protein